MLTMTRRVELNRDVEMANVWLAAFVRERKEKERTGKDRVGPMPLLPSTQLFHVDALVQTQFGVGRVPHTLF